MKIGAAFLDIDGTLMDSNGFHVLAWQQAFEVAGYEISADRIRRQIGQGADNLVPALIDGIPQDALTALAQKHDELFTTQYRPRVVAFSGATELIRRLHDVGIRVLIASSASQSDLNHYVSLLETAHLLAGTVCADDVENSKPQGDIFSAALAKVAPLAAGQTLALGDTPYDVLAAAQVGVRTIGLLSGGFPEDELRSAGAISVYEDVQELLEQFNKSAFSRIEPRS